jgi:hypothetical protein
MRSIKRQLVNKANGAGWVRDTDARSNLWFEHVGLMNRIKWYSIFNKLWTRLDGVFINSA